MRSPETHLLAKSGVLNVVEQQRGKHVESASGRELNARHALEIAAEFRFNHFVLETGRNELKLLVGDAVAVLVVSGDSDSAAGGDRES